MYLGKYARSTCFLWNPLNSKPCLEEDKAAVDSCPQLLLWRRPADPQRVRPAAGQRYSGMQMCDSAIS
jgi:hypothetical protein